MYKIVSVLAVSVFVAGCANNPFQNRDGKGSGGEENLYKTIKYMSLQKPKYLMHKKRPTTQHETAAMIREEARRQGVPENFALGVAYVESGINPNSRASVAGALAVMQVMPGTARQFDPTLTYEQMRDPRINIPLGIAYLKIGLKTTGNNLHATAARYEAGLASGRKSSKYSFKVMAAMKNNTVLAYMNNTVDPSINSAWAVFSESDIQVSPAKTSGKFQQRAGRQGKGFDTPINSLVYDPSKFDYRNYRNGEMSFS